MGEIRGDLDSSPIVGQGHREVWVRLRRQGIRTSRKRVLRLIREARLLAPTPLFRKRSQRLHEGTITVGRAGHHYEPETSGCAEKAIQVLKEQLLWIDRFGTPEELRQAARRFGRS